MSIGCGRGCKRCGLPTFGFQRGRPPNTRLPPDDHARRLLETLTRFALERRHNLKCFSGRISRSPHRCYRRGFRTARLLNRCVDSSARVSKRNKNTVARSARCNSDVIGTRTAKYRGNLTCLTFDVRLIEGAVFYRRRSAAKWIVPSV